MQARQKLQIFARRSTQGNIRHALGGTGYQEKSENVSEETEIVEARERRKFQLLGEFSTL